MRIRKWISIVALGLFLLGLLFVKGEMCDCPSHWAILSVFGLTSLISGPRVYRGLGVAALLLTAIFTYRVREAQIHNSARLIELRKSIEREQSEQKNPQ